MSEQTLLDMVEPMRDPSVWEKDTSGVWQRKDHVGNHVNDQGVDKARLPYKGQTHNAVCTSEKASAHSQRTAEQTEYVIL